MEENIKILNDLITFLNTNGDYIADENFKEEKLALENVIKGYRELEKENKELKEYIVVAPNLDEMTAVKYSNIQRDAYFRGRAEEQQKAEQIIYEHYIPKSKVKEKIEELKKEYEIDLEENSIKAFIQKCQIEILEKLLEEK